MIPFGDGYIGKKIKLPSKLDFPFPHAETEIRDLAVRNGKLAYKTTNFPWRM
jgi:hypothetical protein